MICLLVGFVLMVVVSAVLKNNVDALTRGLNSLTAWLNAVAERRKARRR